MSPVAYKEIESIHAQGNDISRIVIVNVPNEEKRIYKENPFTDINDDFSELDGLPMDLKDELRKLGTIPELTQQIKELGIYLKDIEKSIEELKPSKFLRTKNLILDIMTISPTIHALALQGSSIAYGLLQTYFIARGGCQLPPLVYG
ncbi:MAG: hypothetical protein ABFD18_06120 [Syntrophomonas sp.]